MGTGNNNSTQNSLNSYLGSTSTAAFPYWNNLVRVADASGTYLGYNASTGRGWVLSANHVTVPGNITVGGTSYAVIGSGSQIGSSDLKLYQFASATDPGLAAVPLANALTLSEGQDVLMFGRGFTTSTSSPYAWSDPSTDDANGIRWGTNTIQSLANINLGSVTSPSLQRYLVTDFDGPGDAGTTAFDAQASLGDSGGGMFVMSAGSWSLAGVAHFVDDGPDFLEAPETGDGVVDPSQYGDFSAYSDASSRALEITNITGTLIPEPSSAMLACAGLLPFLRRTRRGSRE